MADPPPTLDDMTELMESIPVTNQVVNGDSPTNDDYNANYYFVNVTEPLADLSVRATMDGQAWTSGFPHYSPPTPTLWWKNKANSMTRVKSGRLGTNHGSVVNQP